MPDLHDTDKSAIAAASDLALCENAEQILNNFRRRLAAPEIADSYKGHEYAAGFGRLSSYVSQLIGIIARLQRQLNDAEVHTDTLQSELSTLRTNRKDDHQ